MGRYPSAAQFTTRPMGDWARCAPTSPARAAAGWGGCASGEPGDEPRTQGAAVRKDGRGGDQDEEPGRRGITKVEDGGGVEHGLERPRHGVPCTPVPGRAPPLFHSPLPSSPSASLSAPDRRLVVTPPARASHTSRNAALEPAGCIAVRLPASAGSGPGQPSPRRHNIISGSVSSQERGRMSGAARRIRRVGMMLACAVSVALALALARGEDPDAPRGLKKVTATM